MNYTQVRYGGAVGRVWVNSGETSAADNQPVPMINVVGSTLTITNTSVSSGTSSGLWLYQVLS